MPPADRNHESSDQQREDSRAGLGLADLHARTGCESGARTACGWLTRRRPAKDVKTAITRGGQARKVARGRGRAGGGKQAPCRRGGVVAPQVVDGVHACARGGRRGLARAAGVCAEDPVWGAVHSHRCYRTVPAGKDVKQPVEFCKSMVVARRRSRLARSGRSGVHDRPLQRKWVEFVQIVECHCRFHHIVTCLWLVQQLPRITSTGFVRTADGSQNCWRKTYSAENVDDI